MSDEDFGEEEVWSFVKGKRDVSPNARRGKDKSLYPPPSSSSNSSCVRPHTTARLIPKSAPVIIPDWSKIYRQKSFQEGVIGGGYDVSDDDEDEFNVDGDRVPPHEWIAKKLARSKISSFSVCEGAGRTLKNRVLRITRITVRESDLVITKFLSVLLLEVFVCFPTTLPAMRFLFG